MKNGYGRGGGCGELGIIRFNLGMTGARMELKERIYFVQLPYLVMAKTKLVKNEIRDGDGEEAEANLIGD